MKRILASAILVFMLGTALFLPGTALASVLKFDFPATTGDGTPIIVQVNSRTNPHGNVTVCNYYDKQTGAFLGQVQGSTSDPRAFCEANIPQSA